MASDDLPHSEEYLTYRPLSNLPTPPPSSRQSSSSLSSCAGLEDGEPLRPSLRGPAIHLVNLIPSSASVATASVPLVQAMLARAALPIETVALAVCILDSLNASFARIWRLACPLLPGWPTISKRHTLPPALPEERPREQWHIDSVSPELIILAALVIAAKFTQDPQDPTQYYCGTWGRGLWTHDQLNVTERCIMASLNYRIMPLFKEDCLSEAMVDMQLAARQPDWPRHHPITPPGGTSDDDGGGGGYVPSHSRSKTMSTGRATGFGLALTPAETPATAPAQASADQDYFGNGRS